MLDAEIRHKMLDAAAAHVPFDGWSRATFEACAVDAGIDMALALAVFPRGPVDLALGYHAAGDEAMLKRLADSETALGDMRFSQRVAAAVRFRLEASDDKEMVRRGTALFALPHHGADGARAIWQTADHIWTALGDTSDDINWYTKRATLSGVYSATVLYWLGDTSDGDADTWAFLDRRIGDVMQIETMKAKLRDNKALTGLLAGPLSLLGRIRAPRAARADDLPGHWHHS
ncbi:COQ9 family protein [Roseovarius aestuarii]|nr:COQ9 family protein [Roseovarius aestuarii]